MLGRMGSSPFEPDAVQWSRISPRFADARRVSVCGPLLLLAVGCVIAALVVPWWPLWLPAGLLAALAGWLFWLAPRQARAWAYAERDDDLLIRSGIMFRRIIVVPYGRMQFVDVQAGPVDRMFGIAQVELHTASASTDAAIPGLIPDEAARLRDRLASRGQAQLAGL
jgi:membrane protein YdbS with pleckstrin-like domain